MEDEQRTFGLRKNMNKAAAVRQMCQTEGFNILQTAFAEKIEKATKQMLDPDTSDEKLREIRRKAQLWIEIEKTLKQIMITGEFSRRALESIDEDLSTASPEVNSDKENQ